MPVLIPHLVESLRRSFSFEFGFEVILVDDASPDNTLGEALALAENYPEITVISLAKNFGQQGAIFAGLSKSKGKYIATMDDDGQHKPEAILELYKNLLSENLDVIYGVPFSEEHGAIRSFASRAVKRAMVFSGVKHADLISALRVFKSEILPRNALPSDPSSNLDILLGWCTDRIGSTRVEMSNRQNGKSNYNFRLLFRHAKNMMTATTVLPLRLATIFGLATSLFGLIFFLVTLILYFNGQTQIAGYTTITSLIAVFSGAQLLSLGIMGEYLARVFVLSLHKPLFIIRSQPSDAVLDSR